MPDVLRINPDGSNVIAIKYSDSSGDVLDWDGRSSDGRVVTNGTYEIQITEKNNLIGTLTASKTVVVLGLTKTFLGNISIVPNPYTNEYGGGIDIRWDFGLGAWSEDPAGGVDGAVTIRILNVAGEMVRIMTGSLHQGDMLWDTKAAGGAEVSNGVYIVIVDGRSRTGYSERKIQKLAITRGGNQK